MEFKRFGNCVYIYNLILVYLSKIVINFDIKECTIAIYVIEL
jgi:hypothetical protein